MSVELTVYILTDMPCIEFTINGKICRVDNTIPRHTTLNAYIRYYLGLPGTKAMCHQGVCGACIVMVHGFRATSGKYETFSVNSCLVLALSCHGWEITTIEEIGNRRNGYDAVQKRIAKNYGTQCGYCTPGFVMHLHSLLPKKLQMKELENSFGSNTCRCTGYRPILDTIKSFGSDAPQIEDIEELRICEKKCDRKCSISSEWSVLEENDEVIEIDCGSEKFYKVWTIEQIFEVIRGPCEYRFVDGNTAQGVLPGFSDYPPVIIDISDVTTLKKYYFDQNLVLGGNISIEDCITIFKKEGQEREEFSYLLEFVKHLDVVAHIPVRKIASLAGNFMIKHIKRHYQSDLYLLFECVGAVVTIKSENSELTLTLAEFLKQDMKGFLITNFKLPPLSSAHVVRTYKITPRNQNALAIVNAAFNFKVNHDTLAIEEATIVYGNITETFVHAFRCEKYLQGRNMFSNGSLQSAIQILNQEIQPDKVPLELSPMTRKKIAIGVFYRFILSICPPELYPYFYASGATNITRPLSSGKQLYPTSPDLYPLTKPVQKLEAIIQTSGEAAYVNDMPLGLNDVFAAFVLSTVHGGSVDSINYDILETPGVVALLTAKDIPGKNSFGFPGIPLQEVDEYILGTDDIQYCGQPIAIIVAASEYLAVKMAEKVEVTYKNVPKTPAVITIDEAKEIKSRYKEGTADAEKIVPKGRGEDIKKVIKGKYYIGAQYHYYLEPQTSIVVPVDKGFEVHSATQWIDLTQICVARCLGIKESDVLVIVRRLGGGFGGKLSRSVQIATACAVVAKNLNRPCRFILPFGTSLASIGRRPPAQCTYEVGVDEVGKIQYLDATVIQDYGCSKNENTLSYVAGGFPNCYNTDYYNLKTAYVITDLPSNTFARAPGTLEGIACIENIMEHIAQELDLDVTGVRLVNMRKDDNDIPELINELKKDSDYEERNSKIIQYNKDNRWMKKSIHIAVMLFPVIYYGNYSAIVSIYRGDGTVTVTTGGIEMGQGVNTKAAQVCAYKLGIPVDMVSILPNYSFACANGVFSGSSIVSESVCFAIIKACDEILDRIKSLRKSLSNPTWLQLIQAAADQQIDLCAEYMMNDKEPTLAGYSAFSVAICETTLDVLTGRFQIDRVDILEDAGTSTNPTVDIGQVEGAYIQGLSYHTMEDFMYSTYGKLLNDRALYYDVFLAKDIPVDFRVKLRFNSKNPKGVLGSKTVGEMGICVAYGITYALRKCINESRKESGYPAKWFDFGSSVITKVGEAEKKTIISTDGSISSSMPWGHVISTDTVPYTILSEIDPILGESYPVPAKQRTEVGGDLANRFEWRYFLRRLQSNKGKSSKAVAQIGRKLRVNGENLLTLEYDRDTSTVAIFMDDKVELLNVTYDRMARPVRWGPRSGIFADVELDYDRFNRLTSWRWGQLNETYGFDRAGRLHEIRYGDGSSLAYSFRDMFTSLPLKVTTPRGSDYLLDYDDSGALQNLTTPRGHIHTFALMTSLGYFKYQYFSPMNRHPYEILYNDDGYILAKIFPHQSGKILYVYDNSGKLETVLAGASAIRYVYHENTHLVKNVEITDPDNELRQDYKYHAGILKDEKMKFSSKSGINNAHFKYQYDGNARLSTIDMNINSKEMPQLRLKYNQNLGILEAVSDLRIYRNTFNRSVMQDTSKQYFTITDYDDHGRIKTIRSVTPMI